MLKFPKRMGALFKIKTKKQFGFSLVEMFMTILIIGLVAAITIPSIVQMQQEQSAISKLRKTFSAISRAISMSETENENINTWSFPIEGSAADMRLWFGTYLESYLKNYNVITKSNSIIVRLPDGVDLELTMSSTMEIKVYINGYEGALVVGKNVFFYELVPNTLNPAFKAYDKGTTGVGRDKWKTGIYACSAENAVENRRYCAGLIMHDNWTIEKDYPW